MHPTTLYSSRIDRTADSLPPWQSVERDCNCSGFFRAWHKFAAATQLRSKSFRELHQAYPHYVSLPRGLSCSEMLHFSGYNHNGLTARYSCLLLTWADLLRSDEASMMHLRFKCLWRVSISIAGSVTQSIVLVPQMTATRTLELVLLRPWATRSH